MASLDNNVFLETVDSLWFFSNILSSPSPSTYIHQESTKQAQLSPPQHPEKSSPDRHPTPQPKAHTVETGAETEQRIRSSDVCRAPRCIRQSNMELGGEPSSREQRARRKLKSGSNVGETEEYMQLGLRLAAIDREATWISTIVERQRFGLSSAGQSYHSGGMPTLTDGFAMKEHLKSWAHAVACTVK